MLTHASTLSQPLLWTPTHGDLSLGLASHTSPNPTAPSKLEIGGMQPGVRPARCAFSARPLREGCSTCVRVPCLASLGRAALQVPGRLNTGLEFKGLRMREHVEHLLRTGLAENAQRAGRTPGCIPPVSNFEGPVGFGNVWEAKHGTQSSESTTGVEKGLTHACACGAPPTQRACRKTRNGAVVRPVASPQSQTLRAPSGLAKRCY